MERSLSYSVLTTAGVFSRLPEALIGLLFFRFHELKHSCL